MSKKHRTDVPDFSSHKQPSKVPITAATKAKGSGKAATPAAAPRVKPQATSAKSGRRGG